MKQLLFTVSVLAALICGCGQQDKTNEKKEKTVYNKEFGWTMTIPAGFDSMSVEEIRRVEGTGIEAMEKTHDMDIENRGATILAFRSNQTTYFNSSRQPFDTAADGNYEEGFYLLNKMIYRTFRTQMPAADLDSSSTKETISGLEFLLFRVRVSLASDTTECLYYRRLFGKKELVVNIASANKKEQAAALTAWRDSKFGNVNR